MPVGIYSPSRSGVKQAADLPAAKRIAVDRAQPRLACPICGHLSYRDRMRKRLLHDVGDLREGHPCDLDVQISQHCCSKCNRYFDADITDLAPPGSSYTHRVIALAVQSVVEDGLPYRQASWRLWRDHLVFVPFATIQNWVEAAGKKASRG